MRIGDYVRSLFATSKPATSTPADNVPHQKDVAWSDTSTIYSGKNWPKYNPDELIGRKGVGIYKKMMHDEQVKAVVRFRRDAISSRDFYFEIEGDELPEDERDKRIGMFNHIVGQMSGSWMDAINGVLSAMYNGFSMTEKIFKHVEYDGLTWVGIDKLKLKPFDTFSFHVDEFGNVERNVQKWAGKEQDIDSEKFIKYVQNPDTDEHYGGSELRECYRPWFSKDITIRFQNIYLERMAGGFIWAAPREGKTLSQQSPEYRDLQSALTNISTKTSLIVPSGIELHVEQPANTEAFEKAIAQHDKAIAKALLVPNLMGISEQGSTGAYAQSQTQLEAFLWTLGADSNRLEECLNEQLFRELGELNFGDGFYPRLKFKPLSETKKMEIVRTWKELVTAGAVQATDVDEAHMRELLDIPAKIIDDNVPDLLLNGAQVTAMVDVVSRVGLGQLTPESALELLVTAFPITREQAQAIVANAKIEAPPVDPNNPNPDDNNQGNNPETKPKNQPPGQQQEHLEETVVGKLGIKVSAFAKAVRRVDFAVIGSKADDSSDSAAYDVASANGNAVQRLVAQAEALKLGTAEGNPDDVSKLKYSADELSTMKASVMAGLKEGWKIGQSHAGRELQKANKERFGRKAFASNDLALQDVASSYFKARGHQITGDISSATQKQIQSVLLDGIKNSKSFRDTKTAIYKALESEGLLTDEDVIEALGTKTVKNTKARIDTIMRTSTFEAINEARYQTFSDPELSDFVEALEYAAILDDRTTEICSQLNSQTFKVDDPIWSTFRPPNHYNCRSLLIPVTVRDTWSRGDEPSAAPQKGFGFHRCESHK